MTRDVRIALTRQEMSLASQGAAMRWQLARASGVTDQQRDRNSKDTDIDLVGLKAEIAVAKAYGLSHNPTGMGIDEGIDMWAGDIGIDVKASFHADGNLLFKRKDAFRADVSVLVAQGYEDNVMVIKGWVTQARYLEQAELETLAGNRTLILPHSKLSAPETLWRYITQANLGAA